MLGQILELFADAEGISAKFKSRGGRAEQELLVHDTQTDLEPAALSLHNKMRDLSIKRQNQTPLRQKAKCALYEEKHFKRLIEDITSLVNDLIEILCLLAGATPKHLPEHGDSLSETNLMPSSDPVLQSAMERLPTEEEILTSNIL
ncbi:MAG: hypothetical protein Q9201_007989 [Fulgogasparrea decipioides]